MGVLRPFLKGYHRSEVRGLENFPAGGALVVSNHSGGLFPMDVPVFASGFYEKFGYDRPVYTLSHDMLLVGPTGDFFKKTGFIPANHENADEALRSGGVVVVFPGGDYDVYRPTLSREQDRLRRPHRLRRAALNAGVPIVPTVGDRRPGEPAVPVPRHRLAKALGPIAQAVPRQDPADLVRLPVRAVGGPSAQRAAADQDRHAGAASRSTSSSEFGEDPDIDEVDAHVRHVMQRALDELAEERRLPVLRLTWRITDPTHHRPLRPGRPRWCAPASSRRCAPTSTCASARPWQRENMAHHIGFRRRRAALPATGPAWSTSSAPDLARDRPARRRAGRRAAGAARRASPRSSGSWPATTAASSSR